MDTYGGGGNAWQPHLSRRPWQCIQSTEHTAQARHWRMPRHKCSVLIGTQTVHLMKKHWKAGVDGSAKNHQIIIKSNQIKSKEVFCYGVWVFLLHHTMKNNINVPPSLSLKERGFLASRARIKQFIYVYIHVKRNMWCTFWDKHNYCINMNMNLFGKHMFQTNKHWKRRDQ